MHRPESFKRALGAFMLCALAVLAVGCSGGPEQAIIRSYFTASRVNDSATLGNIAMVSFAPDQEGTVQNFSVENVVEEIRVLRMQEMSQALEDATNSEDEFTELKIAYQDENVEAIGRVLEAEVGDGNVARRDLEVQEAWTKWREDTMVHAKAVSDAQAQLTAETAVAELSLFDPSNPIDVTGLAGDLTSKDVTIQASVKTPDAQEIDQTMVVTLERVQLTGADGAMLEGRWVITGIETN